MHVRVQVRTALATPDELSRAASVLAEGALLCAEDRACMVLSQVPRLAQRIDSWLFLRAEFDCVWEVPARLFCARLPLSSSSLPLPPPSLRLPFVVLVEWR